VSANGVIAPASASPAAKPAQDIASTGLTSDEARTRLEKDGPNAMPDTSAHPLRNSLAKFWAPVPWLLEASTVLELVLHKYYEAAVIAALLIFNAALAYFQESRAQATLAALKSRLALDASVQRDGAWKTLPAVELVYGDLVKLSLGAVVAADVHLTSGSVQLDQSMLTGESLPIEAGAGVDTYAGALVRRGDFILWRLARLVPGGRNSGAKEIPMKRYQYVLCAAAVVAATTVFSEPLAGCDAAAPPINGSLSVQPSR